MEDFAVFAITPTDVDIRPYPRRSVLARWFGPAVILACSALLTNLTSVSAAEPDAASRPNVLIIHVDQHRIDCLGAYGNADVKTPHIDQLAAEGVRYENSFCPYPVCTPSRYSLLSGMYVNQHRGWSNRSTLAPEIDTFARVLRSAGYRTCAVGKMHFTPTYLDVGFDRMLLAEQDGPGRWDDDYHRYLMRLGLVDRNDLEDQRAEYRRGAPPAYWETFGAMTSNLPEAHHSTTWIADQAVETLDGWNADGSYLLMVGFIKPHHPSDPPAPWHEMYDPAKLTLLPGWTEKPLERDMKYNRGYFPHAELNQRRLRRAMAYYYATVSQIDHQVGRMIERLKSKGLYDNTLIVYTADHGDFMGFHHMLLKGNFMYDPLVKVPLIIKWPGGRRAGQVSSQLVNNVDLAPTICRVAGCRPGMQMRGNDLTDPSPGHRLIFAEHRGGREVMARSRTHKLIDPGTGHDLLFFDLEADPFEMNNAYGKPEYRDEIAAIEKALAGWRSKDARPKQHQDLAAPQIDQPNVPADLSHRDAAIKYYQKKMSALQGEP
jgi:arylsulfatase